jgi:two-component system, OmpR family, sensor kinase
MARHFLALYLSIVVTLAAVSWGQDRLLQIYGGAEDTAGERTQATVLTSLESELKALPPQERRAALRDIAAKTGASIEIMARGDITGQRTLGELDSGKVAYLDASAGESWALKRLDDTSVLAYRYSDAEPRRGPLEWLITLLFYAAIALVIMFWLWPLTRDLRILERAAARYGNKNWAFDAPIKPRSQIYKLAETFRKMAERIDGLIASHKDMSNAVSHEIKTPLARMRFEIECAEQTEDSAQVKAALANLKTDIAEINDLVTATLNYAILERADMSLNIGTHNFTTLVPAIAEYVRRDAHREIRVHADVQGDTDHVLCDGHLMEAVLKNLLYNAARYARHDVRVTFVGHNAVNQLIVDDDGPGIPEKDRRRVFDSFVQLDHSEVRKTGFGLGLAIVRRTLEWHGGEVRIAQSPLGGARVCATWPTSAARA